MIEGKSIEQPLDCKAVREFFETLLEKCPQGGYIHWGFNEPKPEKLTECPTREEVAERTYHRILSRTATEMLEKGRADFSIHGLNRVALRALLEEFLKKNYTLWYRKPDKRYSHSAEFYVATSVSDRYLEEYYDEVHWADLDETKIYEDIKS